MFKKLFAYDACPARRAALFAAAALRWPKGEYLSGMKWDEPPVVTPGKTSARSAVGRDHPVRWQGPFRLGERRQVDRERRRGDRRQDGDITTKQSFGDCQLHVEWSAPCRPRARARAAATAACS